MAAGTKNKQQPRDKTYQWDNFQKEADRLSGPRQERPAVKPFVIDDVQPPIILTPPDEKTAMVIAEQLGFLSTDLLDPRNGVQRMLPLLRAFCGDQFPRVWSLLPAENTLQAMNVLMQALVDHFQDQMTVLAHAREAAELPGGSEASPA